MRATPILCAILVAGALDGCAALRKADAPTTLRLTPVFSPASATLPGSIAVAPVQARGLTGASRYAYIDAAAPSEIRQAASLFWEEPPPRVLERALVAGLRTRFAVVSGSGLGVAADRRVVATLTRFEEVGAGGAARAVVGFEASVIQGGQTSRTDNVCAASPISSAQPTARARAFEAATHDAVDLFAQAMASGASVPASTC